MSTTAMMPSMNGNGRHADADHLPGLLPHHLQQLRASGLSDETITAAGIHSETDYRQIAAFLKRNKYVAKNGPGIVFPFFDSTGAVALRRVKPDNPPKLNGRICKYLQPTGVPIVPYITPQVRQRLDADPLTPAFFAEGEKKALCVSQRAGPCIGLTGIDCFHRKKSAALLPELQAIAWKGRKVYIVYDAPANEDVRRAESQLASALKREGADVKIVRLPPGPNGEKVGVDDFIVVNGVSEFWRLVNAAEDPAPVDAEELRMTADSADPSIEAKLYLKTGEQDGLSRLRYHGGGFVLYSRGAYADVADAEVKAQLVRHLDRHLRRLGSSTVNDILMHVKAQSLLNGKVRAPCWLLDAPNGWQASDVIATPQQIIHLPSIIDGKPSTTKATPNLFTTTALDYEFNPDAARPTKWLAFLQELWGDDQESIDTLQEVFGYLLSNDTRQHKIIMLLGPPRAGKGVIARILRALVGPGNCAGPTLASLGERFGLWPLLNKSVAIISDARLSGRTDSAIVVERLLSVSGEDALTVDRKCMPPVTTTLQARIVLLTNELPRLGDASGALTSRLVPLKLSESFLGREDRNLTTKLLTELPAILLWAINGWARLNDRGHFILPQSSAELLGEMGDLASPIKQFVRERCSVGEQYNVAIDDLFSEWKSWCAAVGRKEPGNIQMFGRDLSAAVPSIRKRRPRTEDGDRQRTYDGIGVKMW